MNRLTGLRVQAMSFTFGAGGSWTGRNAQCRIAVAETAVEPSRPSASDAADVGAGSGHGAPIRAQAVRSSIACWGSLALGGILTVESYRIASTSGLSSGWPGTTTGPASFPFSTPSRVSSRRPDSCFLGP